MKIKHFGHFFLLSSLVVISCNFEIPKSVSIASHGAEYNAPLGSTGFETSDFLDIKSLKEKVGGENFSIYDYRPSNDEKKVQRFLFAYPIHSVDFNVPNMMGNILEQSDFSNMNFEKSFTLPAIDNSNLKKKYKISDMATSVGGTIELEYSKYISMEEMASNIESAVIGEGKFVIKCKRPSSWSNVTCTVENLTFSGAMSATTSDFTIEEEEGDSYLVYRTLDLKDKTITPQKVDIYMKVALTSDPSSSVFTNSSSEVEIDGLFSIENLSTANVIMSEETKLQFSDGIELSEAITQTVKTINFKDINFICKLRNGLPAGNDISVTVNSTTLGFSSETKDFPSNSNSLDQKVFTGGNNSVNTDTNPIPLSVTMDFPGGTNTFTDSSGKQQTYIIVKNLQLEKEYTLAASFEAEFDWESVTLKDDYVNSFQQFGSIDANMALTNVLSSLPEELDKDKISLAEAALYLYVTKPDLDAFSDVQISLNLDVISVGGATPGSRNISNGPLECKNLPDFSTAVNGIFTTYIDPDSASKYDGSFADTINAQPDKVSFSYDVSASGTSGTDVTITKEELESAKESHFSTYALIELPLKLVIADPGLEMQLLPAKDEQGNEDTEKDIFDRSEADSWDVDKLLDILDSVSTKYKFSNDLLENCNAKVVVDDGKSGSVFEQKLLELTTSETKSSGKMEFTSEDVKKMLAEENYPFMPTVNFSIGATTSEEPLIVKYPPSDSEKSSFDFSMILTVKTDGSYKVFGD